MRSEDLETASFNTAIPDEPILVDLDAVPDAVADPSRARRRQVAFIFFWLLGGDFAFTFFEQIFGRFIPLFVAEQHGSNTLIGLMTGSFAGLMNLFFLPNIAMRSDRHRGRLGRRIPLLLWATPCTVVSLLLVCFAPELGGWLDHRWPGIGGIGRVGLTLGMLCGFVVSYHFWNMVLVNAYNWLIRDVVPPEVIGRFLAWFRIVSTVAAFVFTRWVFPVVLEHRRIVFSAVGIAYLTVFLGMCWQIEEGEYPPPGPVQTRGMLRTYAAYFRECLRLPLYRNYFFANMLIVSATTSVSPFLILFARRDIGLTMTEMGSIPAWGLLTSALAFVGIGRLCDRYRPLRVLIVGIGAYSVAMLSCFFFVHDRQAFLIYTLLISIPSSAWGLASNAFNNELFPRERFGQFSAGLNVFGYCGIVVSNYAVGSLIDHTHNFYRLALIWGSICSAGAMLVLLLVYRDWKRHGGPHAYQPPLPGG